MIERTFQDIPEGKLSEADRQSYLVDLGWSGGMTWEDLLRSRRVLMISEAGAGKTHECRERAKRLCAAGEPAFFIELAALATGDLRSQLDGDEEARLDAWLSSQSDIATFFLDSIDELKLTLGSFEQALKRLKKGIDGQLGRARIVTTTRPTAFDERLLRDILPVPPVSTSVPNEETFANFAMGAHPTQQAGDEDDNAPDWRTIALMPLSDAQIAEFAKDQGIDEPAALLEDLKRRNAQEFARRPQNLIELCADWREHKRIRTHRDQVAANVRVKLQPRDNGRELAELSADKAIEGATRESRLWNEFVARYHYLGYKTLVGAQMRYAVHDRNGWPVAMLGFSTAAWKLAPRDNFIGWTPEKREKNLSLVIDNPRFLILPWIEIPNLGSHILAIVRRRLPTDWTERYNITPVLIETFVETPRYTGAVYRASGWTRVGTTRGRGRYDRLTKRAQPKKDIWLRSLRKDWRRTLNR